MANGLEVSDSLVDISIDAMERRGSLPGLPPALARLSELVVGADLHFLQIMPSQDATSMYVGNYIEQPNNELAIKEVIIQRALSESFRVDHYAISIETGGVVLRRGELKKALGHSVPQFESDTPPFMVFGGSLVINRHSGGDYDENFGVRALHIDLVSSPEDEGAFLADTEQFLQSRVKRTRPIKLQLHPH